MADEIPKKKRISEMTPEERTAFFNEAPDRWGDEFCTEFIQSCNEITDDEPTSESVDKAWTDFKSGKSIYVGMWEKGAVAKTMKFLKPDGDISGNAYEWRSLEKAKQMVQDMTILDPDGHEYAIVEDDIDENGEVKRSLYNGQVVQNGYRIVVMNSNEPVPTKVVYHTEDQ